MNNGIASSVYDSTSDTSTIQYDLTTTVNGQLQTSAVTIQVPGLINNINYIPYNKNSSTKDPAIDNNGGSSNNMMI